MKKKVRTPRAIGCVSNKIVDESPSPMCVFDPKTTFYIKFHHEYGGTKMSY